MNRELKTGLYIFGGLALATGIYFAVKAMIGDDDDLSKSERKKLEDLLRKEQEGTLTEEEQEILNDLEEEVNPGIDDVVLGSDDCPAVLGNNTGGRTGCKQVAQLQTAINQKHGNNEDSYSGGFQSTYCCTGSDCDSKLSVDGVMGPCTMRAVKKYYGECCECVCDWRFLCTNYICSCLDCSINTSLWGRITSGADISDTKLCSEGYTKACTQSSFSGYSNVAGGIDKYEHDFGRTRMNDGEVPDIAYRTTGGCGSDGDCPAGHRCINGDCQITTRVSEWRPGDVQWNASGDDCTHIDCEPPEECRNGRCQPMGAPSGKKDPTIFDPNDPDGQHRNFTLSSKQQLRGNTYSDNGLNWRDQQGPLGDFFPGRYDFVDDNPPVSVLEHSYGMGKGFGFDGSTSNGNDYISYTNSEDWTEFEAPTQTLTEFYDDVP